MISVISLGAVPLFESSVSQDLPDFEEMTYEACERYIALIRQKFGKEPLGVSLIIVSPAIAIPNYYEVECYFDGQNFKAVQYVLNCKQHLPKTWNDSKPPLIPLN